MLALVQEDNLRLSPILIQLQREKSAIIPVKPAWLAEAVNSLEAR